MANMEELMALFGSTQAPGAEDPRRRRGAGAGGAAELFNSFLPFVSGLGGYDYSGPGRGLAGMLRADELGPAARHFQRLGAGPGNLPPGLAGRDQLPPGLAGRDELPPGLDNRNPLGGPNVAPGNIDTGEALLQPSRGRALGQAQAPHTQGWLNVAPGYAVAAARGFGTDQWNRGIGFQTQGPGAEGGVRGGGAGGAGKSVGGAAPTPTPQGGGSTARGAATGRIAGGGGGGGGGGGNQIAGVRPGQQKAVKKQSRQQPTARGGFKGAGGKPIGTKKGGGAIALDKTGGKPIKQQRKEARNNAYENAQKGNASGTFYDTINIIPNAGNNNTPTEIKYSAPPKPAAGKTKPKTGSNPFKRGQR